MDKANAWLCSRFRKKPHVIDHRRTALEELARAEFRACRVIKGLQLVWAHLGLHAPLEALGNFLSLLAGLTLKHRLEERGITLACLGALRESRSEFPHGLMESMGLFVSVGSSIVVRIAPFGFCVRVRRIILLGAPPLAGNECREHAQHQQSEKQKRRRNVRNVG